MFRFGGPDIFPLLIRVSLRNLVGIWVVFFHVVFIQHWPSCVVPSFDGLDPCEF